jgi:hypothetical protein
MTSKAMRNLLTFTGTPQTGNKHIGPLPNLMEAIPWTLLPPPIRILGNSTSYQQIQSAYNAAWHMAAIQSQQLNFTENLVFDKDISITLEGGYDVMYMSNAAFLLRSGDL